MRRQNVWWCRWRRRIPPGAMIASWVPWPILASGYRTRRWATSCVASGGNGFLYGGSAYAPRLGYLLRVVLYPVGESEGLSGRNHAPSGPAVDGTDGAQRDHAEVGISGDSRYLLHDRDSKFCMSFRQLIEAGKVKTMPLPARSPNLNAYAERWVRSVKQECLSKLILFGERPLRRALQQYVAHYHEERNHQGKQNRLLFPLPNRGASGHNGIVRCKERLGGLLKYYEREAA